MANISLTDLNPKQSSFVLKGKKHYLKPFTLSTQAWAMNEFATIENKDGLHNLSLLLHEADITALAMLGYELLEDKNDFPVYEDFLNAFGRYKNVANVLIEPITQSIGVSQPTIDELEQEAELKKSKAEMLKALVVGPLFLTFSLVATALGVYVIFLRITH